MMTTCAPVFRRIILALVAAAGAAGSVSCSGSSSTGGGQDAGGGAGPGQGSGGAPDAAVEGSGGTTGSGGAAGGGGSIGGAAGTGGAAIGTGGAAGNDGGGVAGQGGAAATLKIFDQIPQFGIYRETEPNYTPPTGMLAWTFGTVVVAKLSDADKSRIGTTLTGRVTYHAQCDNYDRLGSIFFITKAVGQAPTKDDPRVEVLRYITPFSDYRLGALATYAFPAVDLSPFASVFADPSKDVWLGMQSGANPYTMDACATPAQPAAFREVGYKISFELASSGPSPLGTSTVLAAKSASSETAVPVSGMFDNPGERRTGRVVVTVSGHGSAAGGVEYLNTRDVLRLNGADIGMFNTEIDCASYARFSPDGNQGIFRSNLVLNPRNWCPGALVAPHVFPATLEVGANPVSLTVTPTQVPSGSYYLTTIVFISP